MATVSVRRPRKNRRSDPVGGYERGHTAILRARGGPTLRLPIAPRETERSGDAPTIEAVSRPGRAPLTRVTEDGLPVLSFTATVAKDGLERHVEGQLRTLLRMAQKARPLVYQHGSILETGLWRISSLTPAIMQRTRQNRAAYVDVNIELTRATDTEWDGGKDKGGGRDRDKGGRDKARVHVWRKGDTPAKVARRYYDNPNLWHLIADANNIRKPRRLKPGRRLRIPPRRRHRPGDRN